jgi:hypothetical protein
MPFKRFALIETAAPPPPVNLTAYDFASFKKIVDAGGGNGTLLRGVRVVGKPYLGIISG